MDLVNARASWNLALSGVATRDAHSLRTFL